MVVEPHRHEGIFIARGKEDALVTRNICVGESVYGEKRIAVESQDKEKVQCANALLYKGKGNGSVDLRHHCTQIWFEIEVLPYV